MIQKGPENSVDRIDLAQVSFLGDVRSEFLARNQKLVGDIKRDPARDEMIASFVRRFLREGGIETEGIVPAAERLLHRFEVLCARVGRELKDKDARKSVYADLLHQLTENVRLLGLKPGALVTATLLNESPLFTIPEEAPFNELLARHPFLLQRAVESFPARPREYLLQGIQRLEKIDRELDQAGISMHRRTRLNMAFNHLATAPEEILKERQQAISRLISEPEFKSLLSGREWVAEHLMTLHGDHLVRPRLREIHLCFAQVLADDAFAPLRKRPSDIIVAAINHPHNTAAFLSAMLAQEERLRSLLSKSNQSLSEKDLRILCLKTPIQAKKLEQELQQKFS